MIDGSKQSGLFSGLRSETGRRVASCGQVEQSLGGTDRIGAAARNVARRGQRGGDGIIGKPRRKAVSQRFVGRKKMRPV